MKKKISLKVFFLGAVTTASIYANQKLYFSDKDIVTINNNSSTYQPNQELQSYITVRNSNLLCGGGNNKVLFIKNDSSGDRILYLITLSKMYAKRIRVGVVNDLSRKCFVSNVSMY